MFYDIMVYIYIYFFTMILLILGHKYMLIILIYLEIMVLSISLVLYLILNSYNLDFFLIYFLVFSVCESVMGVTLLVLIVRFSGNDLYYSFNMTKF